MRIEYFQRICYDPEEMTIASRQGPAMWLNAYQRRNDAKSNIELVEEYLSGSTSPDCLLLIQNDVNQGQIMEMADWFAEQLRLSPLNELKEGLECKEYAISEEFASVPQISAFDASRLDILDILSCSDLPLTYDKIGYHLLGGVAGRNIGAKRKYGENASQFAAILGLVNIGGNVVNPEQPSRTAVELTWLGRAVQKMTGGKSEVVSRLLFKSVLFRDLVSPGVPRHKEAFLKAINALSPTTRKRRASAFAWMLNLFLANGGILECRKITEELLCHMRH